MERIFNLKAKDYLTSAESKVIFNREHFTESAPKYDLATVAMSLGQDQKWKRTLISLVPGDNVSSCLDLASGTGDLALMLADKFPESSVIGVDITEAMLEIGRKRRTTSNLEFVNQDIANLDFENNSFDVVTGGYALRNSPNLQKTLVDVQRYLKVGGCAYFLDFAKPENKFQQVLQYYILKIWGSSWGLILHGNPEVHGYISASLKNYPKPSVLNEMFNRAGFQKIERRKLFLGMMEIIILVK